VEGRKSKTYFYQSHYLKKIKAKTHIKIPKAEKAANIFGGVGNATPNVTSCSYDLSPFPLSNFHPVVVFLLSHTDPLSSASFAGRNAFIKFKNRKKRNLLILY
jgi:hypothetical protein